MIECRSRIAFPLHWALVAVALGLPGLVSAQELTPRAYWPAPVGTTVLIAGYGYQWGDIVTDPSLPVVGVNSRIHQGVLAIQRTLDLFGRTSNLQIQLPYVDGTTRGQVEGETRRRDVQGTGDMSATLSINLYGAPAMSRESFQSFRQDPSAIVAASIKIVAPSGQYDDDRLINIGTNRWATRIQLGYVQPFNNHWMVELAAGAWFFSDNDEFLGSTREQDPISSFNVSLIRRIRPGFWASMDANFYFGGRTVIDDTISADFQRNTRLGVSVSYPFKRRHVIRAAFATGLATESGGDFNSLGLTYLFLIK